jgi:hypothetical protein
MTSSPAARVPFIVKADNAIGEWTMVAIKMAGTVGGAT